VNEVEKAVGKEICLIQSEKWRLLRSAGTGAHGRWQAFISGEERNSELENKERHLALITPDPPLLVMFVTFRRTVRNAAS
jgi:hypothetical protein